MLAFLRKVFTENAGLKTLSLILALAIWFYIVRELNKGSDEEKAFLGKVLPMENVVAKKLVIKPLFVGQPKRGYAVDKAKVAIVPEYVIVIGAKDMLNKVRFAYSLPIDLAGASKTFTASASLSSIAPGVFLDETAVQITVPIEKER